MDSRFLGDGCRRDVAFGGIRGAKWGRFGAMRVHFGHGILRLVIDPDHSMGPQMMLSYMQNESTAPFQFLQRRMSNEACIRICINFTAFIPDGLQQE